MKKHSILVTGAGGFIGANLVRRLIRDNYIVHVIWKKTTNAWRLDDILSKLSLHEVELADRAGLVRLMHHVQPYAIIHLAAHGAYSSQTDIDRMVQVNIEGTLNLLLASRDINYQAFINTGSSSEYGPNDKPMKETDALKPPSFYAATKASATYISKVFAQQFVKPIITLRPFSVYGPYEEPGRFVPTIIHALLKQTPIQLTPGSERRDFVFIDDIVEAYLCAIRRGKKVSGQVFNLGTGIEYTNDEVVDTLFKTTGKRTVTQKGLYPKRTWDTDHWAANTSLTHNKLKWKFKTPLHKGLAATYHWLAANKRYYE